jgi:hypothetical protein
MEYLVFALLGLGLYFLPAIIAGSRGHHNSGAILLLNLVPAILLLALAYNHNHLFADRSLGAMLALALSGQLLVYQLMQWVLILIWLGALVWSCTYVEKEAAAPDVPPLRRLGLSHPHPHEEARSPGLLGMAALGIGVGVVVALMWQPTQKTVVAPMPTIARSQATPDAPTPPRIITGSPANKKVSGGDAVKREAERVQWCRAELRKPAAQRSERAQRSCNDVR